MQIVQYSQTIMSSSRRKLIQIQDKMTFSKRFLVKLFILLAVLLCLVKWGPQDLPEYQEKNFGNYPLDLNLASEHLRTQPSLEEVVQNVSKNFLPFSYHFIAFSTNRSLNLKTSTYIS